MTNVGMDVVFLLGGAAAVSGVLTLLGVRAYTHGSPTRAGWWA